MSESQKNLIKTLIAFLFFSILIFRKDLLYIENRENVNRFLNLYAETWGVTISFLLFLYYLSRFLKIKPVYLISFFSILELFCLFMFYVGPKFLKSEFKNTFMGGLLKSVAYNLRVVIQQDKASSQYDKELFYTLKPYSVSRFKGKEFDTEIRANSKGVRDSEENLNFPEAVFVGDSFTMGWGVEENESYARLFAGLTGLKTLNTGISSYGTARERLLLNRFNLDSTRLMVLQYNESDLEENRYFVVNKNLGDKDEYDYEYRVGVNDRNKVYYFFKYCIEGFTKLYILITSDFRKADPNKIPSIFNDYPTFESDYFEILHQIQEIYKGPLLTIYLGGFFTSPKVIEMMEDYSKKTESQNLYFLNLGNDIDYHDYFFYDDHLNREGHQKVAEKLFQWYQEHQDIFRKQE